MEVRFYLPFILTELFIITLLSYDDINVKYSYELGNLVTLCLWQAGVLPWMRYGVILQILTEGGRGKPPRITEGGRGQYSPSPEV